jgi:DNA-binding beta-propeller fold protein YncE
MKPGNYIVPKTAALCAALLLFIPSCMYDKLDPVNNSGFPRPVWNIMKNNCSVTGCHTTEDNAGAVGLDLSSWEAMFRGGRNNSNVIPYRSDQSILMYSINTFSDFGLQLIPTMPFNKPNLSRDDVMTIKNWIDDGAPNDEGYVKFSENPHRKKIYIANQGCDLVSVYDAETKLLMRVIDVGRLPSIEIPHYISVSPDGEYWYVVFINSTRMEKYRCSDDVKVGEVDLGLPAWHTISISGDSKFAIVVHWDIAGAVARVDLTTFQMTQLYGGFGFFHLPHGSAVNQDGSIAYISAQTGNFIYRLDMTDPDNPDILRKVLQPGDFPNEYDNHFNPHQVKFSPDYLTYCVSVEVRNEVRFFNASNDSLLAVVPTCDYPQEMEYSETRPYLFVTSYADATEFAPGVGCVTVLNYLTHSFVTNIYSGFQPHQLAVDDEHGYALVANRNISTGGPAPHHSATCAGRNGYVTAIDLNTLTIIPGFKAEVSVDPYSVAIRK